MLDLSRRRESSQPASVADKLLACHEKIRRFSALGVKIAESPDAPLDEIAEAAAAVHRYFTVALPRHVIDEDESIKPRLLAAKPAEVVATALETVTREHATIDALALELAPLWDAAAAKRAGPAELARELDAARRFEELLRAHLALEEETVFAALPALAKNESDAIVSEMEARRR